jgi:hypothetical protein
MSENPFYDRRAVGLSVAEVEAIETLEANGWIAVADVYIEDSIPKNGDGSPTHKFGGRHPLGMFKQNIERKSDATNAADLKGAGKKKLKKPAKSASRKKSDKRGA